MRARSERPSICRHRAKPTSITCLEVAATGRMLAVDYPSSVISMESPVYLVCPPAGSEGIAPAVVDQVGDLLKDLTTYGRATVVVH